LNAATIRDLLATIDVIDDRLRLLAFLDLLHESTPNSLEQCFVCYGSVNHQLPKKAGSKPRAY
jgi:hypothetical protein